MLPSLPGSVKQTGSIDLRDDYIQNPLFVGGFSFFGDGGGVLYGFCYNKGQGSAYGGDPDPVTLR